MAMLRQDVGAPAANSNDTTKSRRPEFADRDCSPRALGDGSPIACCAAIANFSSPVALGEAGATSHTNLVWPGMATGATASAASHSSFAGMRLSVEFDDCSKVTSLPVYADMRPMIAVMVHADSSFCM